MGLWSLLVFRLSCRWKRTHIDRYFPSLFDTLSLFLWTDRVSTKFYNIHIPMARGTQVGHFWKLSVLKCQFVEDKNSATATHCLHSQGDIEVLLSIEYSSWKWSHIYNENNLDNFADLPFRHKTPSFVHSKNYGAEIRRNCRKQILWRAYHTLVINLIDLKNCI